MMTGDDKALAEAMKDAVLHGAGFLKNGEHVPIEDVYVDPRDARIEAQAAEIKAILDREADTYRRHDAKVDALEAEIEKLREALAALIEQCRQCEKELTEAYYGVPYSGESEPLCKARAALGETK